MQRRDQSNRRRSGKRHDTVRVIGHVEARRADISREACKRGWEFVDKVKTATEFLTDTDTLSPT